MRFTPSVYEHAARLIDKSPWEVSRSADLLYEAHAQAFRLYEHSPVIPAIDIYNLEAEAYGAVVEEQEGNAIPAISRHVCSTANEILGLEPFDPTRDGRIPMTLAVGERLAVAFPDADVKIPVSGPFSLASNLMGFEALLCEAAIAPDTVRLALLHLVDGQVELCREIVRSGLGVAFFESGATPPLLSPAAFSEIELPALKAVIEKVSSIVGRPVPCIIGGDTVPILDYILETGTQYVICPSETNQGLFMTRMREFPDVTVRINMDPAILAAGNLEAAYAEVDRVLTLAGDRENVCVGTGVLPYETDPEVVTKIKEYVLSKSAPSDL